MPLLYQRALCAAAVQGDFLIMTIMNLNKQGRLYSSDYRPWFWHAGMAEFAPLT